MREPKFRVLLDSRAIREFEALPVGVQRRFEQAFAALESDPFRPRPGCDIKRLGGQEGLRRVRVGAYRGLFDVEGSVVRFSTFGHRREMYR